MKFNYKVPLEDILNLFNISVWFLVWNRLSVKGHRWMVAVELIHYWLGMLSAPLVMWSHHITNTTTPPWSFPSRKTFPALSSTSLIIIEMPCLLLCPEYSTFLLNFMVKNRTSITSQQSCCCVAHYLESGIFYNYTVNLKLNFKNIV